MRSNSRTDLGYAVNKKKKLQGDMHEDRDEKENTGLPRPGPAPAANMMPAVRENASSTSHPNAPTAPVAFMGRTSSPAQQKSLAKPPSPKDKAGAKPATPQENRDIEVTAKRKAGEISTDQNGDVEMKDLEDDDKVREADLQKQEADRAAAEARRQENAALQAQILREKEEAERVVREAREKERARMEEERRLQREREEAEAKKRQEELQKRRLEQEKQRREDQERRRREAEEREATRLFRARQEEERLRREALPAGLRRYIELSPEEARSRDEILRWLPLKTVTTRDLEPECDEGMAKERWVANIQVAPILVNGDLELSQCKS